MFDGHLVNNKEMMTVVVLKEEYSQSVIHEEINLMVDLSKKHVMHLHPLVNILRKGIFHVNILGQSFFKGYNSLTKNSG
jgi:hypothetical protein